MSSYNFKPAITSINLFTEKDSSELVLYKEKNNTLNISCTIDGLTRRTIPYIHETLDYTALYITLYHQFGGEDTIIVRSYMVEYDSEQRTIESDIDRIELEIPIDDDFTEIDFVSNYYYLQISFTYKKPDEMGITESIRTNPIFNTKIPFVIKEVL
ncbi:hypothetical protein MRP26_26635 [Bacillus sp. CCB-MMP212]|uniref:hypothetical protein n=1 Tax=Bacillus sp. CCB-MMP212 TaxID=2928002 RepID=UPI001F60F189|nr:hypothetical protein [Bacillus sp. CCB-MMP212]MCI4252498.1 hypothetical protein [Bacillus sp. CCB-MMP212]